MNGPIVPLLAGTAGVTALLVMILVSTKLLHRELLRWRGVRSAHYTAAVGELLSRRMIPARPPAGWATDPRFHDVLADYRLLVTGAERAFLDDLASRLGIHRVLVRRTRRRFPPGARLRAVATLVDLATPLQRHHLRSLLGDRDPHVRMHVVRGLARLHDLEWIPHILDRAARAEPWEAARIADSLLEMGHDGVEPIVRWVQEEAAAADGSVEVVSLAARVLGLIGDPAAEPLLIRLLTSDDPDWRVAAASALEHTGGTDAIGPLLEALDDRAWRVRARAAVALGAMAEPESGRALAALLHDPVWWVRQNAAGALGRLPNGHQHLLAALEGSDPYAADAALNQLTVSGALASALDRVRTGTGTEDDHQLATAASSASS